LGADFPAFETDVRAALADPQATNLFHEDLQCGYTVGRKPT